MLSYNQTNSHVPFNMTEKQLVYRLPWYVIACIIVVYSCLFYLVNRGSFVDLPLLHFLSIAMAYSVVFLAVRFFITNGSGNFRPLMKVLLDIVCLYLLFYLFVILLLFVLPRQWTHVIYKEHLEISLGQVAVGVAVFIFRYSVYAYLLVLFESRLSAMIWMGKRLILLKKLQLRNRAYRKYAAEVQVGVWIRDEVGHLLRNLLQQVYAWHSLVSTSSKQHIDLLLHYILNGLSEEQSHFIALRLELEAVRQLNLIYPEKRVDLLFPDHVEGHLVPRFLLVSLMQNCQKHAVLDGTALLRIQLNRHSMHILVRSRVAERKNWMIAGGGTGMERLGKIVHHFYADTAEVETHIEDEHYILTIKIDYRK